MCPHIRTCVCVSLCACVRARACVYVCMNMFECAYMYIYRCVCVPAHLYTYQQLLMYEAEAFAMVRAYVYIHLLCDGTCVCVHTFKCLGFIHEQLLIHTWAINMSFIHEQCIHIDTWAIAHVRSRGICDGTCVCVHTFTFVTERCKGYTYIDVHILGGYDY